MLDFMGTIKNRGLLKKPWKTLSELRALVVRLIPSLYFVHDGTNIAMQ